VAGTSRAFIACAMGPNTSLAWDPRALQSGSYGFALDTAMHSVRASTFLTTSNQYLCRDEARLLPALDGFSVHQPDRVIRQAYGLARSVAACDRADRPPFSWRAHAPSAI
jgi:hypothetical protein